MKINKFEGENAFLSNFYECKVFYNGLEFNSTEAAFQAQKDTSRSKEFINLSPSDAKRLGRRVKIISLSKWDSSKDRIMFEIVLAKFSQNEELKQKLINTYPAELIEGNTWNDTYWGVCKGNGLNKLGNILMEVRDLLMTQKNRSL